MFAFRDITHGAVEDSDPTHHPVYTSKAQGVLRTKIERGKPRLSVLLGAFFGLPVLIKGLGFTS